MDLVEWKVPVERKVGAANCFQPFYLWLYTCAVQTADPNWLCNGVLLLSSVLGFPLYEGTADGRAATHQLYSFAIDVGLGANELTSLLATALLCNVDSIYAPF